MAELTSHQLAMGDVVHVVYRYGDGHRMKATSVKQIWLPSWSSGGVGTAVFALRIAAQHRSLPEFDVVHLHGDFPEIAPLSWLAHRRGARLVMTVHGGMNPRYRGQSSRPLRLVDHFIALGQRVADDLIDRGVPVSKISVMSSGLNTDMLDAASPGPSQPGLVVSVGSLDRVKNHELVIRSVIAQPPYSPARLVIIGDGPDRERLQAIAGGSNRVQFLGHLSREQTYRIVASAQIFCIASKPTSTKAEGVPTALLEAMHLSRHCLVSKMATPKPVVTDTNSYQVFDPDSDELIHILQSAIENPRTSAELGRLAHSSVAQLDWATTAMRVHELLARQPPDAP